MVIGSRFLRPERASARAAQRRRAAGAVLAATLAGTAVWGGAAGAAPNPPLFSAKPGEGVARAYEPGQPDLTRGSRAALPSSWPLGPDVASWQHPGGRDIDWRAVRAAGNRFAVIKSTEGRSHLNPYFRGDWHGARAAGLVRASYHYARPGFPLSTAADQANRFLNMIPFRWENGTLAPILDLEETGGLHPADLQAWTRIFLRTVENRTGRAPILYTYPYFWRVAMASTRAFTGYPLWIAVYNGRSRPGVLPGGWARWRMWQYSSTARIRGIFGLTDRSAFCCTTRDLVIAGQGTVTELWRRYLSDGYVRRSLGRPTRFEGAAWGGGRWQPYRRGLMTWSVVTGARMVRNAIAATYLSYGGSRSFLGLATSDEFRVPGGWQSSFVGGALRWSDRTRTVSVIRWR